MLENTGKVNQSHSVLISKSRFADGYAVFPFDLSPDLCNGAHLHESKVGDIEVQLEWREPLAEPITVLVHLNYEQIYMLDSETGVLDIATI